MYTLRIEHPIPDYDGWKKAFDSDPIDRKKSGVRRYRIFRAVDDERFVSIELDFDTVDQARSTLAALNEVWKNVGGKIMSNPQTRILRTAETQTL